MENIKTKKINKIKALLLASGVFIAFQAPSYGYEVPLVVYGESESSTRIEDAEGYAYDLAFQTLRTQCVTLENGSLKNIQTISSLCLPAILGWTKHFCRVELQAICVVEDNNFNNNANRSRFRYRW